MKNPKTIFAHLFADPSKLNEHLCYKRLLSLLPAHLREMTSHVYRKGETLYFVLTHPGFVMELNYSKTLIKELLTTLANREPACAGIKVREIRAYARFAPPPRPRKKKWSEHYAERARGEFECPKRFSEIFCKIKEAIRKNGAS